MSGDPPPVSGSPYIIICNGRIGVAAANNQDGRIVAASQTATDLTSFMQSHYENFNPSDCRTLSYLQHKLMDHLNGSHRLTPEEVDEKIEKMFVEMDELEDKYE